MKIVIIGSGGMGVITLARLVAEVSIRDGKPLCSSEIHGMAKKGGMVEVHMKIGKYLSPLVTRGDADFVIIMDSLYTEYAKTFLGDKLITLDKGEVESIAMEFGGLRFLSTYMFGKFMKVQKLLSGKLASGIVCSMRESEVNIKVYERGVRG